MFRNMVNGKLFLIYIWNKGNSDMKLEYTDEELLGGSVIA